MSGADENEHTRQVTRLAGMLFLSTAEVGVDETENGKVVLEPALTYFPTGVGLFFCCAPVSTVPPLLVLESSIIIPAT